MNNDQPYVSSPLERAQALHQTIVTPGGRLLVADFSTTLQGKDTSKVIELMPNQDGRKLFRFKFNAKEVDPLAAGAYGKKFVDTSRLSPGEIEECLKQQEFDFALWFKHIAGYELSRALDYNAPFILQVAGCNFHSGACDGGCLYCFVDNELNDGQRETGKKWLVDVDDVIDSFLMARDKVREIYKKQTGVDLNIKVLRVSGGEPTIALDWIIKLWRRIEERGEDIVGQVDTNLSTPHLWPIDYYRHLAVFPVKVLAAIKGTDNANLRDNVQANATISDQVFCLRTLVEAGLDIFPQMYNPNPDTLVKWLNMIERNIENFALRVHIGPLKPYGPTLARLKAKALREGKDPEKFSAQKIKEWETHYQKCCGILDGYLRGRYGVGYRQTVRSDVKLSIVR
ncbi:MAG: radical SAM protein [Candidatus Buchananbacteria bacterium]